MDNSIKFLSVNEFKSQISTTSLEVLKNPKTGKLFMSTDSGDCYRVQQDIDNSKDMKVLIENGDIANACLVNVSSSAEQQFTL